MDAIAAQTAILNVLHIGGLDKGDSPFEGTHGSGAIWATSLSDRGRRAAEMEMRATLESRGADFSTTNAIPLVIFLGDSITDSLDGSLYNILGSTYPLGVNLAEGSKTIDQMIDEQIPRALAILKTGRKTIVRLQIGRNNWNHSDPAKNYSALALVEKMKYAADRLYFGGVTKVIVQTLLPSTPTGWNTHRNNVNSLILAGEGIWHDRSGTYKNEFTMGSDGAELDPMRYPDGTHPSGAGNDLLAAVDKTDIDAIAATL